jgi:HAMP domain-containing protein
VTHDLVHHSSGLDQQERRVWAEKSFAGTIPDDIAAERQQALAKRLIRLREELGRLALDAAEI